MFGQIFDRRNRGDLGLLANSTAEQDSERQETVLREAGLMASMETRSLAPLPMERDLSCPSAWTDSVMGTPW